MSTSEQQSVALISEIFRHTLSSQDTKHFSVSTLDKFNGSSPEKLETFEAQCQSVFLSNKRKYSDPTCQAVFTGSYLEGAAFEWWKNELRKLTNEFKQSAHHFWDELQTHFGNLEYWCIVKERLTFLQMKETDHINQHITEFETLSAQTNWNQDALHSCLYWSLNHRLREDLSHCDPATTKFFRDLKAHLISLDYQHWECQEEICREKIRYGYSDGPSNYYKGPSPTSSQPPRTYTDSSGWITVEERKRHFDNRLCLYCGKEGHAVKNCPAREVKGRATDNGPKN